MQNLMNQLGQLKECVGVDVDIRRMALDFVAENRREGRTARMPFDVGQQDGLEMGSIAFDSVHRCCQQVEAFQFDLGASGGGNRLDDKVKNKFSD